MRIGGGGRLSCQSPQRRNRVRDEFLRAGGDMPAEIREVRRPRTRRRCRFRRPRPPGRKFRCDLCARIHRLHERPGGLAGTLLAIAQARRTPVDPVVGNRTIATSRRSSRIGATIFSAPTFSFSSCAGSASARSAIGGSRSGPGASPGISFNTCCCGSFGCGCERWWSWNRSSGARRRSSYSAMPIMSSWPASRSRHLLRRPCADGARGRAASKRASGCDDLGGNPPRPGGNPG